MKLLNGQNEMCAAEHNAENPLGHIAIMDNTCNATQFPFFFFARSRYAIFLNTWNETFVGPANS